jgi:hypothetical protein
MGISCIGIRLFAFSATWAWQVASPYREFRFVTLALMGYVVVPEHIHLLIDELPKATPST